MSAAQTIASNAIGNIVGVVDTFLNEQGCPLSDVQRAALAGLTDPTTWTTSAAACHPSG